MLLCVTCHAIIDAPARLSKRTLVKVVKAPSPVDLASVFWTYDSSSSNAFASFRSAVSNPSVNQP